MRAISLALMMAGLVSAALGEDWPAYDKDSQRSAVSREQLSLPLHPVWIHRAAQRPRPAWSEPGRTANMFDFDTAFQPVVAGGMVYFGSSADDTLYALSAVNGTVRWTYTTGGPIRFAPQIAEGRCYFASDDGVAYCLDAQTGTPIWVFQAAPENRMIAGNGRMISRWPCRSGVLVHDQTVFLTAGMWPAEGTYFYALDARNGKPKWTNDTLNAIYLSYPHDGVSFGGPTPQGYLVTDGKTLLVPTGQSAPAALDASTGQLLYWHQQKPGSTWVRLGDGFAMVSGRGWQPDQDVRLGEAPLFHGDGVAFYDLVTGDVTTDKIWRGYDSLPGSERSELPRWRGQITPLGGRDRVILDGDRCFASGMGKVEALDVASGKLQRRWKIKHPRVYSLILAGDHLLAGSDGFVAALDAANGKPVWRGTIDGQARGLAVAQGMLFVATDQGAIYAFARGKPAAGGAVPNAPLALATVVEPQPPTGFALVVGVRDTARAEELAAKSRLNVICLLPDKSAVAAARRKLLGREYGQRIVVAEAPPDGRLPFADFFANEIIVDGGAPGIQASELYRVLHPCTGRLTLLNMPSNSIAAFVGQAKIPAGEVQENVIRRGRLEGAFDWNSTTDVDQRIKWPLELLWFGGPGRERTMARHRQGLPPPIAAGGRTIIAGDGHVTVIDAYNGFELWSRVVPEYQYVSADDEHVYIGLGQRVMQCAAQSGRLEKVFGSAEPLVFTLDQPAIFSVKGKGKHGGELTIDQSESEITLTFDTKTPRPDEKDCWTLWFDFRDGAERLEPSGRGAFPIIVNTAEGTLRKFDGFVGAEIPILELKRVGERLVLTISLDEIRRLTGKRPATFDLSAEISLYDGFDVQLREWPLTASRDPWRNGTASFRLAHASEDNLPWAKVPRANVYELPQHAKEWGRVPRFVRHDGNIPRSPLATETTPDLRQRFNPLSGELEPRDYLRGYGCSGTICSATMDFFRSGTFGMYDLADDSGMRNFAGVRPGCRITVVPAQGVLVSAEGVGDCFCPYNFSTSMALAPARERRSEDWAVFVDKPRVTQMQSLALNLGAPGDRRDDAGKLWLGYPRQPMMFATGGSIGSRAHAFGLPVTVEMLAGGRSLRVNADRVPIAGTAMPWVSASALTGVKKISLGLIYHEPKTTVVGTVVDAAPQIDARFDDSAWAGNAGIGMVVDPKSVVESGRTRVRYDAEHLYFAYEQKPKFDRKGAVPPWTDAYFDVLLKDQSKSAYAQFGVTAQGGKSSGETNSIVNVPQVKDIAIDGKPGDWDQQGLNISLGEGRGSIRLGWNERGLIILHQLVSSALDKTATSWRIQLANLESPALVEMVLDAHRKKVKFQEAMLDEPSDNEQTSESGGKKPGRPPDIVDDPDPAKKELEKFRRVRNLELSPATTSSEEELVTETVVPLDRLRLKTAAGSTLALQVSMFDPEARDQNIAGGSGARRAVFRSGSLLTLSLTEKPTDVGSAAALAQKREWFGTTIVFAPTKRPIAVESWHAAVAADDQSFRAELAIPWRLVESAGLSRDRLLAQFRTPGKLPPNLDLLYQSFSSRSVRIDMNSPSPKPLEYSVRLHFAELEDKQPGQRIFDIKLQGETVARSVDVAREAGGPRRALVKEFRINTKSDVELEFHSIIGEPILGGLEIISDEAH